MHVCADAVLAGDVALEYTALGVSGMVEHSGAELRLTGEPALLVKTGDRNTGSGRGVDGCLDWTLTARRETIWSKYVGQGPGPDKSVVTLASKLARTALSTVNSHSR
jgi:hypothetical protein